jgi:hypothetical protein
VRCSVHACQERLARFRWELYWSLTRWSDTLFELADAVLCVPGPVTSLPELSLAGVHRRGHGSTYAVLVDGRMDLGRLWRVLAGLNLLRGRDGQIRLAVDVTPWPRPVAECSPRRAHAHRPCRCDGVRQTIPGWPYSIVAALESCSTPRHGSTPGLRGPAGTEMCGRRARPARRPVPAVRPPADRRGRAGRRLGRAAGPATGSRREHRRPRRAAGGGRLPRAVAPSRRSGAAPGPHRYGRSGGTAGERARQDVLPPPGPTGWVSKDVGWVVPRPCERVVVPTRATGTGDEYRQP